VTTRAKTRLFGDKPTFRALLGTFVTFAVITAGCGRESQVSTVFAASSMTDFVEDILLHFDERGSVPRPQVNIAGSGTLLLQVDEGAQVDLVILAGRQHMEQLLESGNFLPSRDFAVTSLALIVAPRLANRGLSVDDLWSGSFQGAMCVLSAPCGQLAMDFGQSFRLEMQGLSLEPNVRAVLAKVERGEVDFGLVYETDFRSSTSDVTKIVDSGTEEFSTTYSLAISKNPMNRSQVDTLVKKMTGELGRQTLSELGFKEP